MAEFKTFDWDDMISDDGNGGSFESVVLPEGNYNFEVMKVEKQWHDGSDKIPACNMAKIQLKVDGGDQGFAIVFENLYLYEKMEWKAASFLRSIGLKKHGEPMPWNKIPTCEGCTGRCKLTQNTYDGKNGRVTNNQVKTYFDKEEQKAKKAFTRGDF